MRQRDQERIWEAYQFDDSHLEDSPKGPGWTFGEYDPHLEQAENLVDGITVEVEHSNPDVAQKIKSIPRETLVNIINIVLDHYNEDPDYYKKLQKAKL